MNGFFIAFVSIILIIILILVIILLTKTQICPEKFQSKNQGPLELLIIENSSPKKVILMCDESDYASGFQITGSKISINPSKSLRFQTVNSHCDGTQCDWAFYDLLNTTITFKTHLGNIPCGKNFAFYTSAIPKNKNYCDAQNGCTEIDIMEANAHSWHTTMHKANGDKDGTPIGFGGTIQNKSKYSFIGEKGETDNLYGYGSNYMIDTTKEILVTILFKSKNNDLVDIYLSLEQSGKKIHQLYSPQNENYYKELGKELIGKKHVLIISMWGGDVGSMTWMDTPPCPNTKQGSGDCYISDITITNGSPPSPTPPKPSPTPPKPSPTPPKPSPTPPKPSPTPPKPSPTPPHPFSKCTPLYGECTSSKGSKGKLASCCEGSSCKENSDGYYAQCIPDQKKFPNCIQANQQCSQNSGKKCCDSSHYSCQGNSNYSQCSPIN
jgi:hypothetical protein